MPADALTDRYGLALSTKIPAARDTYVEGVDTLLAAQPGAEDAFQRAIDADPGFALAHAGRARMLQLIGRGADARASAARARQLAQSAPARERRHVEVLALTVEGKGVAALALAREHLAEIPRDVMVLAPCTGVFGLIGFSGQRGREQALARLLDDLAPHYGDDWWFLSAHAFARIESGDRDTAPGLIERALALNPRNANAAHHYAHVRYELADDAGAIAFLETWLRDYPREGMFHCHLNWHLALARLELGDQQAAWTAYASAVQPGAAWGPPLNLVTDSSSFLWRAELAGAAHAPERWRTVAEVAKSAFPVPGLFFADLHCALAFAAADDREAFERLVEALDAADAEGRLAPGRIVPALARAFDVFARGQWDAAIALIEPVLDEHERVGGSRAQRDLIEYTLLAACLRSGRSDRARRLMEIRANRRPGAAVIGS